MRINKDNDDVVGLMSGNLDHSTSSSPWELPPLPPMNILIQSTSADTHQEPTIWNVCLRSIQRNHPDVCLEWIKYEYWPGPMRSNVLSEIYSKEAKPFLQKAGYWAEWNEYCNVEVMYGKAWRHLSRFVAAEQSLVRKYFLISILLEPIHIKDSF